MNAREIVQRTLAYDHPPRVARSFCDSDIHICFLKGELEGTGWKEVKPGFWEKMDIWGNLWGRCDPTSKGEVVKGAIESLEQLETYRFPDFSNSSLYEAFRAKDCPKAEKYILGALPGFTFNIARNLFKLQDYLCFLLTDRDMISRLHDKIDELIVTIIQNWAQNGADGIIFWEDWGTQQQTLIHPELWHQEFFPRFQSMIRRSHELGLKVFMHSCGAIRAIVPGLIEAGIDVLQFDQPLLHGLDKLSEYQKKSGVTFWCPVDIQKVLPTGNETLIRQNAGKLLEVLWQGRGGFIAGYYGDPASIGIKTQWQDWACEEFVSKGL